MLGPLQETILLAAPLFVGPFVCIAIGLFVLFKNPKRVTNRYFACFNMAVAFWNSGDLFILYWGDRASLSLLAYRMTSI
jgi:hypothetical protein